MTFSLINPESLPCAVLMAIGAVLLYLRLKEPTARIAWSILLALGLTHAIVLALLPVNLLSRNVVHYYLGAKYDFAYSKFYALTSAATDRPQIFMHDLDNPPGFIRDDPTEQRAYFIDLLRAEKIEFDPLVPLSELQRLATESGAVHREAQKLLSENLPADQIDGFCQDVKAALITLNPESEIEGIGNDITHDFGYNGSPFYTLVRQLDPTLYFPFGRGTAILNLVWQLAGILLSVWLIGTALGMTISSRIAVMALVFASWDYVAWDLPGLSFAGFWLPIALACWAINKNRELVGGVAIAWAGLIKLFPFALFLPAVIEFVRTRWVTFRTGSDSESKPSFTLLASGLTATLVLGALAILSGRDWVDFLGKIVVQFSSDEYVSNSVSFGQFLLVFGIYRSPLTTLVSLTALAFLVLLIWRSDNTHSRARVLLVLLSAMPWFTYLWFNYYTIAPLILLAFVAVRNPIGAAVSAMSLAIVYVLPPFDGPVLADNRCLWLLKTVPYIAIPAWLVYVEYEFIFRQRMVRRIGVIAGLILLVILGGEAVRQSMIRKYDTDGGRYLDLWQNQAALACYNSLLGIAPQNAMAHMSRGICQAGMRKYDDAEASFRRASELAPEHPHAFLNLAHLLLMRGKLADAKTEIERATALAPFDDAIWAEYGKILSSLGERDASKRAAVRALELNPNNREARGMVRSN